MFAPLPIVYRDDALIVVHKPSGALVHRSALDRNAPQIVLQQLRDQIGQRVYPVHRLDRPTSGLLLFGLNSSITAALAEEFSQHRVHKRYLAVVRGIGPQEAQLDWPLREEDGKRPKHEMPAMAAVTHVKRLDSVELTVHVDRYPTSRYSLMEAVPLTGRRHQIRRHLSHCGHPIIGDAKHGKGVHNRFFRDRLDAGRLLLAAVGLTIWHPVIGRTLCLSAPVEANFAVLLNRFGWAQHNPVAHVAWQDTAPALTASLKTHDGLLEPSALTRNATRENIE
ncbi:pseudouridine synthase [Phytohalomonas tamaricis]|uniref:pseudouridine synthase n=1 Tax=Phytohalomonas tamaricis TaxID=2081032 RepID=UPI000D0AD1A6|nr:pseudouridine synthase [Phytohalomonas tamaricis]